MSSINLISLFTYERPDLDELTRDIENSFHVRVKKSATIIDPAFAYNRERGQYFSTQILERLTGLCSDSKCKILGVTDVDLFIPILTFVFGEALLGGRTGVISTFRLRSYARLLKEAKHELGHTFGLIHCPNINCVLYPSTNPDGVDQKGSDFCIPCRRILKQRI